MPAYCSVVQEDGASVYAASSAMIVCNLLAVGVLDSVELPQSDDEFDGNVNEED